MNSDAPSKPAEMPAPPAQSATSSPQPPPPADNPELTPPLNLQPSTPFIHRGNGKISRFPQEIRDQINYWLVDGISYPEIIQRLGDLGKDLKPDNLSQWKKRGHQDWLLAQTWLAETRARQEPASALAGDFDATQVNHAALQLATLQIFEALRHLAPAAATSRTSAPLPQTDDPSTPVTSVGFPEDSHAAGPTAQAPHPPGTPPLHPLPSTPPARRASPSTLDLRLGGDSAAFVRLINALARASRETMLVQKYRDACAQARAALLPLKDPNRDLTDSERHAIVRQVDHALGLVANNQELHKYMKDGKFRYVLSDFPTTEQNPNGHEPPPPDPPPVTNPPIQ